MDCASSSSGNGVVYPLQLADVLPLRFELQEDSSSEADPRETPAIHLDIAVSRYKHATLDGVRVRVLADDAEEMTTKIFAYVTQPMNPGEAERTATFSHICSPADLEEFPADLPMSGVTPEWLRLDYVDVLVRSWDEALEFIAIVKADVQALRDQLRKFTALTAHEAVWIE